MAKLESSDFDGNSALEADIMGMFADMQELQKNLNKVVQNYRTTVILDDPSFSIGSDNKKIAHGAFTYTRHSKVKSKSADTLGVTLTGSDVPENDWGSWALDIDGDGNIAVIPAPNNATGYLSRREAMADVVDCQNAWARMGYVGVRKKSGGDYQPNVTDLTGVEMVVWLYESMDGQPTMEFTEFETYT